MTIPMSKPLLLPTFCRSDDEVGQTTVLLRDLLEAQNGAVFERNLVHASGEECVGHDSQPTLLTVSCARVARPTKRAKFQQPSLETTLHQSDGHMLSQFSRDSSFSGIFTLTSERSQGDDQQGAGYR